MSVSDSIEWISPHNFFGLVAGWCLMVGHPRTKGLDKADVHVYSKNITSNAEASKVFEHYPKLIRVPFKGVTTDGTKLNDVYSPQSGAPVKEMVPLNPSRRN